ncbi:prevent-host-death protein [Streptomyces sp. NPDC017202]|uniref:prevent-host-death protein n=1 Tax=Streptomyces sp. NPDC017202 TaxID=3364981 RepID=UPI0037B0FD80
MTIAADLPAATRRSSDLSKRSAEVFAEAEDHPVTVTRRDGEALVLMSQREAEGRARLLNFAAQLITVTLDDRGSLAERMSKAFPWMLALSPADQESCAQDRVDAARASFSTDQPHLAIAELTSWKETATAPSRPGSAAAAPVWSGSTTMRPWSVPNRGGRQEGRAGSLRLILWSGHPDNGS